MISWIVLSLVSAVLLGFYDVTKKVAARKNAVPVVLLTSVSVGALIWLPLLILNRVAPDSVLSEWLRVTPITPAQHGLLLMKSVLVGASWTFGLFALKHLPLSIAAPIRSSSPFWTILIAIALLGERPSPWQWAGIVVVLVAFWMFSVVGNREGIRFTRDRWVACMFVATILGAISSIYDRWLLHTSGMTPATVQAWFTIYLVPVMLPLAGRWYFRERKTNPFEFRRTILLISPLLLVADLFYFTAVAQPDALISVISTLRRCSVVIAFGFGISAFGESNFRPKLICVIGILIGVLLLALQE